MVRRPLQIRHPCKRMIYYPFNLGSIYAQLWVYQSKTDTKLSLISQKRAEILKVFNSMLLNSYMLIVGKPNSIENCIKHSLLLCLPSPGVTAVMKYVVYYSRGFLCLHQYTNICNHTPHSILQLIQTQWTPFHVSMCRSISFILTSTEYFAF